jgi:hypothetical protein
MRLDTLPSMKEAAALREFAVVNLRLPVLQTHLPLPGDYRSKEQIERGSALSF